MHKQVHTSVVCTLASILHQTLALASLELAALKELVVVVVETASSLVIVEVVAYEGEVHHNKLVDTSEHKRRDNLGNMLVEVVPVVDRLEEEARKQIGSKLADTMVHSEVSNQPDMLVVVAVEVTLSSIDGNSKTSCMQEHMNLDSQQRISFVEHNIVNHRKVHMNLDMLQDTSIASVVAG